MLLGQFCKISWDVEIWRYHLRYSHKYFVSNLPSPVPNSISLYCLQRDCASKRIFNCFCTENNSAFCPPILFTREGKEIALLWNSGVFWLTIKTILNMAPEFFRGCLQSQARPGHTQFLWLRLHSLKGTRTRIRARMTTGNRCLMKEMH